MKMECEGNECCVVWDVQKRDVAYVFCGRGLHYIALYNNNQLQIDVIGLGGQVTWPRGVRLHGLGMRWIQKSEVLA